MFRLLLALLLFASACGSTNGGRQDHDDDQGDDDCLMDTCGVCDGDGSSCSPESEIVFLLEVEGASLGVFPFIQGVGSVSELVTTTDAVLPGKVRSHDLSLTRRATDSLELASWRQAIEEGAANTQVATLTLSDSRLGTIARWHLLDAWPSALDVTDDGTGLHETVVVTNGGVRLVAP